MNAIIQSVLTDVTAIFLPNEFKRWSAFLHPPPPFPKKKTCLSTQESHLKDPAGFDEGTNARKRERRIALKEKKLKSNGHVHILILLG